MRNRDQILLENAYNELSYNDNHTPVAKVELFYKPAGHGHSESCGFDVYAKHSKGSDWVLIERVQYTDSISDATSKIERILQDFKNSSNKSWDDKYNS